MAKNSQNPHIPTVACQLGARNTLPCFVVMIKLLVMFNFVSVNIYAAWVENMPGQITQPDGTKINVLFSGDEFHNWVHDTDGYTIVQDPATGFWCWAVAVNGDLVSTGEPMHLNNPST